MLVDANLLLFTVDRSSPFHDSARAWLTSVFNGAERVGLPWLVLDAFVRIVTHPRASNRPLTPAAAWTHVTDWLACDTAWIPDPTSRHAEVLGALFATYTHTGT